MKAAHIDDADVVHFHEHRIVLDMTALEAQLFLDDQPTVRREVRRRLRSLVVGCDHAPKGKPKR